MSKTWLVSDTHFSHKGVCHFLDHEGNKLRPWDHPDDMDRDMIELWNATVAPEDKVYHLGDVAINRRGLQVLYALNGRKVLIKGNHDIFKLNDYLPHFYDIRAYHVLDKILLSHIPVHPRQKGRFKGNVHGHLHSNVVEDDEFYMNVCVEKTGFKPINWEEVRAAFN